MNSDPIEMIDLTNVILDNLDLQKDYQSEHGGSNLVDEVVQALYFNVILKSTSLFFFRSRHLLKVLEVISEPKYYQKDDSFWLRTEDLILRVKSQYGAEDLAHIVKIYSKVKVSQMFWVEMEQLLLSKAADFKGKKEIILDVIFAFRHRTNETFWKVFSSLVADVSH